MIVESSLFTVMVLLCRFYPFDDGYVFILEGTEIMEKVDGDISREIANIKAANTMVIIIFRSFCLCFLA